LSQLKPDGSGVCRATCRHPETLWLQTQGSYPPFNKSEASMVLLSALLGWFRPLPGAETGAAVGRGRGQPVGVGMLLPLTKLVARLLPCELW
jgi:hypothetical protein